MENLKIRAACPDDAAAICEIATQPTVYWGTLQVPAQTVENWRKKLEGNSPDSSCVLVAEVDGQVVGNISLFWSNRPRIRHAADLGIMVHDAYQGKGVGAAMMAAALEMADKWLNLIRIELEVYSDNERAIKLYRKFGFEVEGCKRMQAFRDGRYVNALVMSRIRPGFFQPQP